MKRSIQQAICQNTASSPTLRKTSTKRSPNITSSTGTLTHTNKHHFICFKLHLHIQMHTYTNDLHATVYLTFSMLLHISLIAHFFCFFLYPSLSLTFSTYPVIITPFCSHTQPPIPSHLSLALSLSGLSPAQSEFNYLNTARTLELYGVELHYARVSKVLFCDG